MAQAELSRPFRDAVDAEFHAEVVEVDVARLLKRPNKILTREQLIGERELDPFDRSIDVRISRLRRKLEDDPQDPKIIKTVYGAGYLLCAAVVWE